jgi:hypothetical protein
MFDLIKKNSCNKKAIKMPNTKQRIKLSLVVLIFLCFGSQLHAQTYLHNVDYAVFKYGNEIHAIPDNFNLRLNSSRIDQFNQFQSEDRNTNDLYYFPATVVLYSVGDDAKQYNYSYSTTGDRLTTNIKKYINANWVNNSHELCTYDAVGNRLTSLWQIWVNGNYVNSSKTTWTYTTNRNMLTELKQFWTNNAWVNDEKTTNTYDVVGNRVASLREKWISGAWSNDMYDLLTYNTSNKLIGLTRQSWINGVWTNSLNITYTYDTSLNLLNGTIQNWSGTAWVNALNEIYTYNTSNLLTQYFGQIWEEGIWKFSEKFTYTYNTLGFRIMSLGENYVNNVWVNNIRSQNNHNNFGGIQSELKEIWTSGTWVNVTLTDNAYDENGNALSNNLFHWSGNTWVQNQDGELVLYYSNSVFTEKYTGYRSEASYTSILVGEDEINTSKSRISFSPNPAKDFVKINLHLEERSRVQIAVYAINGQFIKNIDQGIIDEGIHHIEILLHDFINGIYILETKTKNLKSHTKFVVTK